MTSTRVDASSKRVWQSPALAGLAAGLYVSAFYVVGNLTMLPSASVALVVTVLTLPIVAAVLLSNAVLTWGKLGNHIGFATAFFCGLYLIFALRAPVFESEVVRGVREQLHGASWVVAHALYFLGLAGLLGLIFRRNTGKLTAILLAMTLASIVIGFRELSGSSLAREADPSFLDAKLGHKPNIYLVLADSFASFAYMNDRGIDVSEFKRALGDHGFRLYENTFSNYHATTDSMLSMLSMQHHYYQASRKLSEVSNTARRIIGGENNLVQLLKNNGYRTEYIHQGDYLMLHGCTADFCSPAADGFSGGRSVLNEVVPKFLSTGGGFDMQPIDLIQREIATQIALGEKSATPWFQYVHLFVPLHADNRVVGRCDERAELEKYSRSVAAATVSIESVVDEIIRNDPNAVIVLSGDHGPFVANQCGRQVDIGTPEEYRDRVSALTAIRWPGGYDGRFDGRIKTNVNVFRYVLASMIDGSTEALGGHVPDDVFVQGSEQVLQILDDGNYAIPPAKLSAPELQALSAGAGGR
jgi:hypothetical protein